MQCLGGGGKTLHTQDPMLVGVAWPPQRSLQRSFSIDQERWRHHTEFPEFNREEEILGSGGEVMAVNHQRQVWHGFCGERQNQCSWSDKQIPLVLAKDHGVPTAERDGQPAADLT